MMARLVRPHIPLAVRIDVAERQWNVTETAIKVGDQERKVHLSKAINAARGLREILGDRQYLQFLLAALFKERWPEAQLHHRPALVNRSFDEATGKYDPDANDPGHLIYLPKEEHGIETRVRGVGALRSDLSERRHQKKIARNKAKREAPKTDRKPKGATRWPKRKMPNRKKPWSKRPMTGEGAR